MVKPLYINPLVNFVLIGFVLFCAPLMKAQTASKPDPFIEFVEAARMGDVPTIKRLLAAGIDVNQRDASHFPVTALYHALDARQFATARVLIEGSSRFAVGEGLKSS